MGLITKTEMEADIKLHEIKNMEAIKVSDVRIGTVVRLYVHARHRKATVTAIDLEEDGNLTFHLDVNDGYDWPTLPLDPEDYWAHYPNR